MMTSNIPANCILLQVELPGGKPPSSFRIFRAGDNETQKGTFTFDDDAAAAVMAAFAENGMDRLPIDFDHGMFVATGNPEGSIAAGWFIPAVVNGELVATSVEWTPRATQMLRDREFRFISPAFAANKSGVIQALLNVAITNLPATKNLQPLVANQHTAHPGTNERKSMQKLLGRLKAQDEAEALTIVNGWETTSTELLSITNTTTLVDALKTVQAGQKAITKVVELAAKLDTLERASEELERQELVAKLPPSMRDDLGDLPVSVLSTVVEKFAKAFPAAANKVTAKPIAGNVVQLNASQKNICQQMGVSEEAYQKQLESERNESEAV